MKKIFIWTLIVSVLLLCACTAEPAEQPTSASDTQATAMENDAASEGQETSQKKKYGPLPEVYSPEQALADECLVLTWEEGAITPIVTGMEYWEAFLEATSGGVEEMTLRVVYFQNGIHYYSDLYYNQGYFSMYTLNEFQNYESAIGSYRYLKRIEGVELNTGNTVCYYVLTDIEDLSSEDVLSSAQICDIEAERDVAYEPIPFTQYLYLD